MLVHNTRRHAGRIVAARILLQPNIIILSIVYYSSLSVYITSVSCALAPGLHLRLYGSGRCDYQLQVAAAIPRQTTRTDSTGLLQSWIAFLCSCVRAEQSIRPLFCPWPRPHPVEAHEDLHLIM